MVRTVERTVAAVAVVVVVVVAATCAFSPCVFANRPP